MSMLIRVTSRARTDRTCVNGTTLLWRHGRMAPPARQAAAAGSRNTRCDAADREKPPSHAVHRAKRGQHGRHAAARCHAKGGNQSCEGQQHGRCLVPVALGGGGKSDT
jgi:hypothetical protein